MVKRRDAETVHRESNLTYIEKRGKPSFFDRLGRNMALAAALILAVSALRNAALPSGETVLTAVRQIIQPQWDDHLGTIDFVGNFFPDTVAVFFESPLTLHLSAPCLGPLTHAWSQNEPYVSYQTASDQRVYAAAEGQVMAVAHGPEEELILRLRHDGGVETMYYALSRIYVQEGDRVTEETCLGEVREGQEAILEVRRAGREIDPTAYLESRAQGEKP